MKNLPEFNTSTLEELSKILANEASGAELTRLFSEIHVSDSSNFTKWTRIHDALNLCQQKDHSSARVFQFIKVVLNPIRYINNANRNKLQFFEALEKMNLLLSFSGFKITENGEIISIQQVQNIEQAMRHANSFYRKLLDRNIHSEVIKYCKPETLQQNYFHAVFEAIKGLNTRIKGMTGLSTDGCSLINTVFSEKNPYLVINSLRTQSELDEHNGFRYLILSVQTMFRNPISHEAKINWEISGDDGLDILTTISLIHRKLDKAVLIRHDNL